MATVEQILANELPKPVKSIRTNYAGPLAVQKFERGSPGFRRDPVSGLYTSVASGKKRIFGTEQSLLLEQKSTNHVYHSIDLTGSSWVSSVNIKTSGVSDLFENGTSVKATGNGSTESIRQVIGDWTGNTEVTSFYLESGTSDQVGLYTYNETQNSGVVGIVDWDGGDSINNGNANVRPIPIEGPNGGNVVKIVLRTPGARADNISGDGRRVYLYPDRSGSGGDVYIHGLQHEEAACSTSMIETGSGTDQRFADKAKVFDGGRPEWWNEREMTILIGTRYPIYGDAFPHFLGVDASGGYLARYKPNPFEVLIYDGSNVLDINDDSIEPYQELRLGIKLTPSKMTLSLNGNSTTGSHNGTLLDSISELNFDDSIQRLSFCNFYTSAVKDSVLNTHTNL